MTLVLEDVTVNCLDCLGEFKVAQDEFVEEEIIECTLCAAELVVVSEETGQVKMFCEDDDF
jgi:hypothetical protein